MTPPSRKPLTCGCTFAEPASSPLQHLVSQGLIRNALAQLTMLSKVERGLKCLWAEQR